MFTFVETKLFSHLVEKYLSDAEYQQVQRELMQNPEAGVVIPGSGGVRKLRWRATGRGKRGGHRLICVVRHTKGTIWMLTLYPKNVRDLVALETLKMIRREIEREE